MSSMYEKQGLRLPRLQHAAMGIPAGAQDQVRAFYGGVLGFQEKAIPQALIPLGVVWFEAGDGGLELHFTPDTHRPDPQEARHLCLEVPDVQAFRAHVENAGYTTFDAEPIPYRPRFFCLDPFGNRLEFTTIEDDYRKAQ